MWAGPLRAWPTWLGFRVVLSDDRAEYATPEAVPDADEHVLGPLSELPNRVSIDENTYILLTTRGVPVDVEGLPTLLGTSAAYVGVIGSRRRWEFCIRELRRRGVPEERIARVTSPMGLELNAESPEEIAVSILAEIIMLRRAATGKPMGHAPASTREHKATVPQHRDREGKNEVAVRNELSKKRPLPGGRREL